MLQATCWLKDNSDGAQLEADRISCTCGHPLPPPAPPPIPPTPTPPPSPPSTVVVQFTLERAHSVATVSEGFVSYDLDYWLPNEGASEGWGPNANVLEVNFNSPKLRALVKALGQSYSH